MSKKMKNIIMVSLVATLGVIWILTMCHASEIGSTSQTNSQMQAPPEAADDSKSDSQNSNRPDGNPPDDQPIGSGQGMNIPTDNGGQLSILCYALLGVENLILACILLYLVMSKFNKTKFKDTFKNRDKAVIYILAVIIATRIWFLSSIHLTQNFFMDNSSEKIRLENVTASGATVVTASQSLNGTYNSSTEDESAVLVKDGGSLTLNGADINKSGDSTNTESSEFYGINAGILVTEGSAADITDTAITTDAAGSNAVFSTGTNSRITISNSTIKTTGKSSSRGLDATYGGYIEAENVDITTQGNSCATLATDRGEGTVSVKDSTLETNGAGSPVIYSTGDISIDNTKGTANGSQSVVIEGMNSSTVKNSQLTCSGAGNRNDVDNAGVMIYQSMSGDAGEGTGTFTCTSSSISISENSDYYKNAPMFFVTNTDAVINLENSSLSYGSNILFSSKGTAEWGSSNANGGSTAFHAVNQELTGNMELDNLSTLTLSLTESNYTGTINGDNSAKNVDLILDQASTITLTGDSYVSSLQNADASNSNIMFNGYTLYVNGEAL